MGSRTGHQPQGHVSGHEIPGIVDTPMHRRLRREFGDEVYDQGVLPSVHLRRARTDREVRSEGNFIYQWKQLGRLSGIYIDENDILCTADSESSPTLNPGRTPRRLPGAPRRRKGSRRTGTGMSTGPRSDRGRW